MEESDPFKKTPKTKALLSSEWRLVGPNSLDTAMISRDSLLKLCSTSRKIITIIRKKYRGLYYILSYIYHRYIENESRPGEA